MRLKVLALLLAGTMVAACSTDNEEAVATENTGQQTEAVQPPPPPAQPERVPLSPEQEFMASVGDSVFFALDKSSLSADAQATLRAQAAFLQANPGITITIEGHADERGTDDYNLALGARRANAARDYLISQGISAGRIDTVSYGESRPFASGSNEASWVQNRRALTVLTGGTS